MLIHSDFHIHSEYSYDASTPLSTIVAHAKEQGLRLVGITDHANLNDTAFLGDLRRSAAAVSEMAAHEPMMVLGVELTPIAKPRFDYIALHGNDEGFSSPHEGIPFPIALAASKEELMALGVRYAIGASHWRVDRPSAMMNRQDANETIAEWFRQQMFLACDERVTILGHPWYHGSAPWYEDFSVIPRSMHKELAAALKENGKYAECNAFFFRTKKTGDKFRRQYAEFLRELFEAGVRITYGSDSHADYLDVRGEVEPYLLAAGFCDGDLSELSPKDLW